MPETTFRDKCNILAELWLDYREDEEFTDFVEYNDLGLPLAYMIANGIVESNQVAERFVDETFNVLLAGLNIQDTGFETLSDLFMAEG